MNLGRLLSTSLGAGTSRIAIGGHRGCGENLLVPTGGASCQQGRVEPALRENTVASFKHAAALGVTFVEFDVQVTRDGVPVLWHDDQIVTRSPGQPAVHFEVKDKDFNEFKTLVQPTTSRGHEGDAWATEVVRTFRNRDTRQATDGLAPWSCSKDDTLPSLEQVFQETPESLGFDIEVKMTLPDTVAFTPAEEVDRVVGPILRCVERFAGARTIMFSSFDPDVCLALAKRQSRPVMFLSGCGLYPHVDARRTGIASALEFAYVNNLAGVVVPAGILVAHPELTRGAAERGLKVMTYGLENNDVLIVQRQLELGVHGAIVDDVETTLPQLLACVPTAPGLLSAPTPAPLPVPSLMVA